MNQSLLGKTYTQAEAITVTREAAQAYAAATVGVDGKPIPAYAAGDVAPPMYGVAYAFGALGAPVIDPELGVEMMRLVHGEQDMRFVKAVKPGDVITSTSTIAAIDQKTTGELLVVAMTSKNQHGDVVLETKTGLFIRGPRKKEALEGEQAEKAREEAEWQALPRVFEDVVVVAADQSKRYAEASGDHNPIHLDEDVAKMAGLPSIILHGLCTMAFVHDALVRKFGPDPLCVKRLAVRFNKPVVMGDTLTIDVRGAGKSLSLQVRNQAGVVVLKGGQAELA
ncbi:MAG: MaoC/PaaZ C-terminal domain-containing protein [Deltaproteobacteria bacterium]|nr:MaoC/PaaZ C-terminal domain-containing protein [Deltaproteobacteria bacterium]